MNLFDILSKNQRVIVYSSEEDQCIYTWNQSLTLQCWFVPSNDPHTYEELDIITLSEKPASFEDAKKKAEEWLSETKSERSEWYPT